MNERNNENEQKQMRIVMETRYQKDYIREAKKFVMTYLPEKAIKSYLPSDKEFTNSELAEILETMIHNYNLVKFHRRWVEEAKNDGREPDPYDIEQIRKGEEIGF